MAPADTLNPPPESDWWKPLFSCRLCWRITFAVFALILLVESAILVPSAARFKHDETQRLADIAGTSVESLLALENAPPNSERLQAGFTALVGQMRVAGLAARRMDDSTFAAAGEPLAVANFPDVETLGSAPVPVWHSADGARQEFAWRASVGGRPLAMMARMDSSHVVDGLYAYILRVTGLVAIIVLIVTAGTMVVLQFTVLRPVMKLRDSMLRAGAHPDTADSFPVRTRRDDEMGEVIKAHNAMLSRVAESMRRDREIAVERTRYATRHDSLTGLPNRTALFEHLDRQRGMPGDRPCSSTLFLVHISGFRQISAGFGVAAGDAVLQAFAARLKGIAESGMFLAHLEAARFAITRLGGYSAMDAATFAERIERDAGGPVILDGNDIPIVARIGIAHVQDECVDPQTLLSQADLALNRTSAETGGKYQFFAPSMTEEARSRQRVTRDLELALRKGGLFLTYQPKILIRDGAAGTLAGAEALVRWRHPVDGLVRPDRFVPIAESTGLILPLGEFVLRTACGQIRDWLDRFGWSPRLAVNLSARQFAETGLKVQIENALSRAAIPAELLEVEITETAAMRDVSKTAGTLRELRALGLRVSIDDFGTGYSSLSYLRRFQVDSIKIDKSFVDDIGRDRNAEAICNAILRLGQALGTTVIAEGVENEAQLAFLRRSKCDEAQGYLFAKPLTAPEFEQAYIGARVAMRSSGAFRYRTRPDSKNSVPAGSQRENQ